MESRSSFKKADRKILVSYPSTYERNKNLNGKSFVEKFIDSKLPRRI